MVISAGLGGSGGSVPGSFESEQLNIHNADIIAKNSSDIFFICFIIKSIYPSKKDGDISAAKVRIFDLKV
jgi:hypothetical protein